MICLACGVQFSPVPHLCPICADSRQYIPPTGQQWTPALTGHQNVFAEEEPGVWSIRTEPAFAIGQRAYLIRTPAGNILWDCVTLLDDATVAKVNELGGIHAIAVSHPHYYSTMAEWAETFQARLYIHANDQQWIARPTSFLHLWDGPAKPILGGFTLVLSGGHFDGYQVGHWRNLLFAGDQPQVCQDRAWVSFLYSYPNMIPFNADTIRRIFATLEPLAFNRLYGAFGRNVLTDAKEVIARSADRYLRAIAPDPRTNSHSRRS